MEHAKPIPWAMRIDLASNDPLYAALEVALGAATLRATKTLAEGIIARRPEVQAITIYQPDNQRANAKFKARAQLWIRRRGEAWLRIS